MVMESSNTEAIEHALKKHGQVKKTIPLFIGLATGFCGSFTSFSSFIRDAFLALSNALPVPPLKPLDMPPRHGGYGFEAMLAILILHTTVSLSALKAGAHLALALDPITPTLPFKRIRTIADPVFVLLGFGSWLGAVLLSIFPPQPQWRGRVTYALVLAPLGCLARFYASKHLNARIPSFPLGTFVVNMLGTVVLGMCFDLQHATTTGSNSNSFVSCQVLQGVMEGLCGCMTTVSTWVAELNGLRRMHSYLYGLASALLGLGLLIIILGSLQWSVGFQRPICI